MSNNSNLYIKQGIDDNGEGCNMTQSGFKFGIPYLDDKVPGCGIGNMRGGESIYLSVGMRHKYDTSTGTKNWVNTIHHPTAEFYCSPKAILLLSGTRDICGKYYDPGVYILSAPKALRELNAIIPDSEITVTKLD